MVQLSNGGRAKKKIISTYKKYKHLNAYSTWLGSRMTADFDFGVQCNIMYFMYESNLPFYQTGFCHYTTACCNGTQQGIHESAGIYFTLLCKIFCFTLSFNQANECIFYSGTGAI